MAKKQPRSRKRRRRMTARKSAPEHESQTAVAITVFWMLSALAAASAEAMWLTARTVMLFSNEPLLGVIARMALFIAAITGGCALLATPLVLRVRRQPPPTALVLGVVAVATAALCLVLLA